MPLEKGKTKQVIRRNPAREIEAGKPPNVAEAISYAEAGMYRKKKNKRRNG